MIVIVMKKILLISKEWSPKYNTGLGLCSTKHEEILKSLKFIGNISNSHIVEFNFSSLSLVLTSKSNDRGGALDKIVLAEPAPDLKVSYLSNHLTKVLEVLNEKVINFNIYNYNDFNLLMVECTNFKHLIFPME